jgi:hypothetical protein
VALLKAELERRRNESGHDVVHGAAAGQHAGVLELESIL